METTLNIAEYASQKTAVFGTEILKVSYEESFLISLISNYRDDRTNLSKKVLMSIGNEKFIKGLKEEIKHLTLKIDMLNVELEYLKKGCENG